MINNIFSNLPEILEEEFIEIICKSESIRIERIVSEGHKSEDDFWYDQEENEWVMVIEGGAVIEFENYAVELKKGDYLNIPAKIKHRVKSTSLDEKTIWLAVFYPRISSKK